MNYGIGTYYPNQMYTPSSSPWGLDDGWNLTLNPSLAPAAAPKEEPGAGRSESSMGSIDIPEDVYPWSHSGLPDWGMDLVKGLTTANLPGLMDSYQGSLDSLAGAPALIDSWVGQSGKTFLDGLGSFQDFIRKPLAGLAGRGVLDSTITRDAMTDVASNLGKSYQDFMNETVGQGLSLKTANLMDQAEARGKSVALGGDLLSLAHESHSEDQLARWTTLLEAVLG